MISIFILIFIIGIVSITIEYTKQKIKIDKQIEYIYVPKSIYDYQYSDIDLENKYDNIFLKDNIFDNI